MNPIPSAKLLVPKKATDKYVLLRQAPLLRNGVYFGNAATGNMILLEREELVREAWQMFRDFLYDFGPSRGPEKSEFDLLSSAEQKRYKKEYFDFLLSLQTPFEVRIDNDDSSKVVTLDADCSSDEFIEAVDTLCR